MNKPVRFLLSFKPLRPVVLLIAMASMVMVISPGGLSLASSNQSYDTTFDEGNNIRQVAQSAKFFTPAPTNSETIYIDPLFGYEITLPENWYVSPPASSAILGAAVLMNYDEETANHFDIFSENPNALKIQISLAPLPRNQTFDDWVSKWRFNEIYGEQVKNHQLTTSEPTPIQLEQFEGVEYTITGPVHPSVYELNLLTRNGSVLVVGVTPADSIYLPQAISMIRNIKINLDHEFPTETMRIANEWATMPSPEWPLKSEWEKEPPIGLCPSGTFPGSEAHNSPIMLWMPFLNGETWTVGGSGSFYGNGYHCNALDDYYATDWNRSGDDGAVVLPVADGNISNSQLPQGTPPTCPNTSFGCFVQIDHSSGIRTLYGHLSSVTRTSGTVFHTDQIGNVGSTGSSTSPHLHLRFQENNGGYHSRCFNNGNPCPNGESAQSPQGPKPSPMNTASGSVNLVDGTSYTSNNGGGGGGCSPNNDQISLFVDANYAGQCVTLGINDYPNPVSIGLPNDSISSIKVGADIKATLCENDNYQGVCEEFYGDDSNLADNAIGDNSVSSVRVQFDPGGSGDTVAIYEHANFGGTLYGWHDPGPFNPPDYMNDKASSVLIQSGWSVRLFEHDNQGGGQKCFNNTDSNLTDDFFDNGVPVNDKVSSVEVYQQDTCPPYIPDPPSNIYIINTTESSIEIGWQDNSNNEDGFNIYWWEGAFVYHASVGANTTTFTDTGLNCGTAYFYDVTAYNNYGESGFAGWIQVDTNPCPTEPDISVNPTSLSSTQDPNTQIIVPLTISNNGSGPLNWTINEELRPFPPPSSGFAPLSSVEYALFGSASGTAVGPAETTEPYSVPPVPNQFGPWTDNFDSYATGSSLHGQGGWKGWFNDPANTAYTTNIVARSGPNSADISGSADLVHEFSGITSGKWAFIAWQYVPGDMTGISYFILLNQYDDSGSPMNWSTQVEFNNGSGLVTDDNNNTLPLITDQWVEIRVEIDLDNDIQTFFYDNQILYTGIWTQGVSGGGILNFAAVDLYANAASSVYYDDLSLISLASTCSNPSDIPWVSLSSSSGTTGAGGNSIVNVTFDSTGMSGGIYVGSLCLSSNDPDSPLVVVPLTLEVTGDPDTTAPVITITHPLENSYLNTNLTTITADATDEGGSGISELVFYVWYDGGWNWVGVDSDGSNGLQFDWDATGVADQVTSFWIYAYDGAGNESFDNNANVTLDRTPPESSVDTLAPIQNTLSFNVTWAGSDNLAGISDYDVQYRDGSGGVWTDWITDTGATSSLFTGENGHTYYFRSRARDLAGNQEAYPGGGGDTFTTINASGGGIISVSDYTVIPSSTVTATIIMTDVLPPGVGATTIDLHYDPTVVTAVACNPDPDGQFDLALCNVTFDGDTVRLTLSAVVGVAGQASLAEVVFTAVGQQDDASPLDLDIVTIADPVGNPLPIVDEDGSITIGGVLGDVNCDGVPNVVDALYIMQYEVGLRSGGNNCPPPSDELYLPGCDVSGDSVCNVVDALYIMQCEVGISNPLCPTEGEGLASTSPAVFDTQAVVSIDSTKLHQFERVESPLTVELPDGMSVAAVTVDVFYESAIVRAVACTPAGPAAFSMCHINQQENSVRFTWLAPLGTTSLVTLGSITFEGVAEGAAKLAVNVTGFVDATGVALPVTAEGSEIVVVATLRLRAGLSD